MRPLLAGLVVLTFLACTPTPRSVRASGTFSEDGTSMLLVESVWQSTDPGSPYFNDTSGRDWEVVFHESDGGLEDAVELARFPDSADALGGGLLYERHYWLKDRGLVLTNDYGTPVVLDLLNLTRTEIRVPEAEATRLFGPEVTTADGLLHDLSPSPDGTRLAVFLVVARQDPGAGGTNLALIQFMHAVTLFDLAVDGTTRYLGGVALTPWAWTAEPLKLDPPDPVLPGVLIPEPPALAPYESLQRPSYMLWAEDSSGVWVVDRGVDTGEAHEAVFVAVTSPDSFAVLSDSDLLPAVPLPTFGGPVAPDGRTLLRFGGPDEVPSLTLEQASGWVGYGGGTTTTLGQLDYGY